MEGQYFSLGTRENSRIINIIRILFGIVCLAVAIYWIIFNIRSMKVEVTLWITIIFLTGFGLYQVLSGMGLASIFIDIGTDTILLKKNPILHTATIQASKIEKIELFPLNVVFFLESKKKIILRFGTTYPEKMEVIKDAIIEFASSNNISLEFIEEEF